MTGTATTRLWVRVVLAVPLILAVLVFVAPALAMLAFIEALRERRERSEARREARYLGGTRAADRAPAGVRHILSGRRARR
jgi:hypothetical protein